MKLKPAKKKCHKLRYASAKDAYAARDTMKDNGAALYGVLRAYRCPYCPGHHYHLGHTKEEQR